ncbi:urea ABC transporter, urea binding protein [Corynebacterium efficiens YS-314]|uniref:Putative ABC transporter substrate-binding protein n=1 Tax=Corynebacterium efficiens (strain DSM 44549 / YS-314 / AJ 12310 / JCM 11189 / NBRC 100395) TaxID=196164 RepID=Q8FQW7_COREF|nr:urea ABC transporter substrate-binding protein [Corynebacterium efficiens]EEW49868.1 urea ABC transporter, urea binding protein [Corynebacterium efficiens YS-314]BAC17810.1 putative ABC transporter substrate-binding protein [Corynebacterium efficiens YS-314]
MSKKTMIQGLAVLSALALGMTACTRAESETVAANGGSCVDTSGDAVKVGFINSLSGTMAISETTVNESLHMAAQEINADGGVLGKELVIAEEDGASEPATFAERAQRLIQQECVAAAFGGWTSASRKAMLPVFEGNNSLLFYPVQYEGMESSPNIFYTGATTNQQIIPALDYLKEQGKSRLFLVGSDYVFPRTANQIIRDYAEANGMEIVGEDYTPLGSTDFTTIANRMKNSGADAVFNTLNGDSNVAFFRQYNSLGLTAETLPVMSVSIAEEEIAGIGASNIEGQLVAWNYYQTVDTDENAGFVDRFKSLYGQDRVTSDPMQAAYTSLYLWKEMVEKAGSFETEAIRQAADGTSFDAPEGTVVVDGDNNHISKTPRIGQVREDGLIDIIWETDSPVNPDPFLETYEWAQSASAATS